jgi:hypothetical protein
MSVIGGIWRNQFYISIISVIINININGNQRQYSMASMAAASMAQLMAASISA